MFVYKLDRFSRNKYEATIHKHTLKENGVKLVSAMENIPDTPEGIILESLLEGMNQYYSAELRQKVIRGLKENWRKGLATGGRTVFGYDVKDKRYVINEYEAAIVREAFEMYAKGYITRTIAETFKERGYRFRLSPFGCSAEGIESQREKQSLKTVKIQKESDSTRVRLSLFTQLFSVLR